MKASTQCGVQIPRLSDEDFNPILDYAAKGQRYEAAAAWEDAVHWYQRSLACLPNLYGGNKQIRRHPSMEGTPVTFTTGHASRIYTGLGNALKELNRMQDSLLAYRAAICLDSNNVVAKRIMRGSANTLFQQSAAEYDCAVVQGNQSSVGLKVDLKQRLTLIIVTHCTDRLLKYKMLSPPSSKLITATYGSLLKIFGENICRCPKILCYDRDPMEGVRDSQYHQSLDRFAEQYNFKLYTYPGIGLFSLIDNVMSAVTTPYFFFVEHDWLFQGEQIALDAVISLMDNKDVPINAIRFNKRINHIDGNDFIMNVNRSKMPYPLLSTSSYSNNPSIIRTDMFKREWLPQCRNALRRVAQKLGGSAFGIEEILFKQYVNEIRASGFEKAHRAWGTYVFGRVGDQPRVVHLGE